MNKERRDELSALEVIPLESSQLNFIAEYWNNLSNEELEKMGVDHHKLPSKAEFISNLSHQLSLADKNKKAFAFIAMLNGTPIGHCNLNPIIYGETAKLHLHIWDPRNRKSGLGFFMVKKALPLFFQRFKLKEIICEPKASNDAPNQTLNKLGFQFLKKYITVPGNINHEQEVSRWKISAADLLL